MGSDASKAEEPKLDDKERWKVEYEQLSEDFRHLRSVGWQVAFAAVAADGVILVPVQSLLSTGLIGQFASAFLLAVAGFFSVFMSMTTRKWIERGQERVDRLEKYDRLLGFGRYSPAESRALKRPIGTWLANLIGLLGIVLLLSAVFLIGYALLPFVHLSG